MARLLIACSLPAFVSGITEDPTKKVSPRRHLVATALSASLGIWLLGAVVTQTDIPGVDQPIRWLPFAVLLTVLVITGVANAVNIIDGFNGLASMCVLMMMLALGLRGVPGERHVHLHRGADHGRRGAGLLCGTSPPG